MALIYSLPESIHGALTDAWYAYTATAANVAKLPTDENDAYIHCSAKARSDRAAAVRMAWNHATSDEYTDINSVSMLLRIFVKQANTYPEWWDQAPTDKPYWCPFMWYDGQFQFWHPEGSAGPYEMGYFCEVHTATAQTPRRWYRIADNVEVSGPRQITLGPFATHPITGEPWTRGVLDATKIGVYMQWPDPPPTWFGKVGSCGIVSDTNPAHCISQCILELDVENVPASSGLMLLE